VNNVPVLTPHLLRDGETVTIGPFSFQYREYRGDIAALMSDPSAEDHETTAAIDGEMIAQLARVRDGRAPATPPAGFAGNFDGIELLEITRLFGAGEQDGILTIQGEALSGQLGFLKGEIRRAVAPTLSGEAAARALLSILHGRFEFTQGPMNLERNCRVKPDALAMEVARRQDEQVKAAGVASAPGAASPGVPTADALDLGATMFPRRGSTVLGTPTTVASPVDRDDERDPSGEPRGLSMGGIKAEPTEEVPKKPPGALPNLQEPPTIPQGDTERN
jgi:hypothetical protein